MLDVKRVVGRLTETDAQTFKDRKSAKDAASALIRRLGSTSYYLSEVDNTISSKDDLNDVVRSLGALGFRASRLDWPMSRRLKRAVFMSEGKRNPILVREPNRGWGSSILLLGESLARFQSTLENLAHLLAGPCELDVVTKDGVQSLRLTCSLKKGVKIRAFVLVQANDESDVLRRGSKGLVPLSNSVQDTLEKSGFEPTSSRLVFRHRSLKILVDCTDFPTSISLIDHK